MPDAFSPLFSGRPNGGNSRSMKIEVIPAGGPTPVSTAKHSPTPACPPAGEVKVALVRDGDKVTGIRIDCPCGQVVELACVY